MGDMKLTNKFSPSNMVKYLTYKLKDLRVTYLLCPKLIKYINNHWSKQYTNKKLYKRKLWI